MFLVLSTAGTAADTQDKYQQFVTEAGASTDPGVKEILGEVQAKYAWFKSSNSQQSQYFADKHYSDIQDINVYLQFCGDTSSEEDCVPKLAAAKVPKDQVNRIITLASAPQYAGGTNVALMAASRWSPSMLRDHRDELAGGLKKDTDASTLKTAAGTSTDELDLMLRVGQLQLQVEKLRKENRAIQSGCNQTGPTASNQKTKKFVESTMSTINTGGPSSADLSK